MPRLFEPFADVPRYRPHLIAMRHVLEHFEQPAAFIEALAWAAADLEQDVLLLIEVPCIDHVFASGRRIFSTSIRSSFAAPPFLICLLAAGRCWLPLPNAKASSFTPRP